MSQQQQPNRNTPPPAAPAAGASTAPQGTAGGPSGALPPPPPQQQQQQQQQIQPRFEDLTIDDDLPLLPRMQRYVQSNIALQRLVHVRMLGEVALEVGQQLTAMELVPLIPPLVKDSESIIRQRTCVELKILCLVLMGITGGGDNNNSGGGGTNSHHQFITSLPQIPKPDKSSKYYKIMVTHLFPHLFTLISDPDNEVRRAASETIVKLALRVAVEDVVTLALSIPLRLVKEGQKRATSNNNNNNNSTAASAGQANGDNNTNTNTTTTNPQTPAEDLLITASNLLADLSSFLPPTRLSPDTATRYFSPTILALAEDPNFRVRRAAVQALPRMMSGATLEDVKRRLLPKFIGLSGDEMYRVRKASGECLVDVSRALTLLPWRLHFGDVWVVENEEGNENVDINNNINDNNQFYKPRTNKQINDLHNTIRECHEIRRQALCSIAKKLLDDPNKFVRYGMMQFLGPLIASFYPLDRGSMVGGMGGLLFPSGEGTTTPTTANQMGTLSVGVESLGIAKSFTGLERVGITRGIRMERFDCVEDILSYNHSLRGLELILHGESSISQNVLAFGGSNANNAPFGTIGPQFFPHANGMVGRSSALDDDDTDSILLKANLKKYNSNSSNTSESGGGSASINVSSSSPRALFPKFILESRSDALALSRIVSHRNGRIPTKTNSTTALPYPPLMMGRPDPEDLKSIRATLLQPFSAMASCQTGEETTDAEMRVYCAYSLPAVILLFGGSNWERDGLKSCFLDLIRKVRNGTDGDGNNSPPPLPVKRCLASSVHAVAHMLGPEIVSRDKEFLASFEVSFFSDSDEAIRLNMLKNLASFIGSLPPGDGVGHRNYYLPIIHSTIMGEDVLGAAKIRSASNPGVLNWRQRDAVARVMPDLIVLYDASLVREYLWPILKTLLSDSVSIVREDAGWSIPVILRKYAKATRENDANVSIKEVLEWLKETHLDDVDDNPLARKSTRHRKKQMVASEGAFSKRQGYCRILAAVALVMRVDENSENNNNVGFSNESRKKEGPYSPIDPFGPLSPSERDRFRSIVVNDLLPPALEMTVDCVANVRLTLTKCLKMLPVDIRKESHVEEVLNTLEEELMTWDVGNTLPLNDAASAMGATGGGGVNSSDPPATQRMVDGVIMTPTMSAC